MKRTRDRISKLKRYAVLRAERADAYAHARVLQANCDAAAAASEAAASAYEAAAAAYEAAVKAKNNADEAKNNAAEAKNSDEQKRVDHSANVEKLDEEYTNAEREQEEAGQCANTWHENSEKSKRKLHETTPVRREGTSFSKFYASILAQRVFVQLGQLYDSDIRTLDDFFRVSGLSGQRIVFPNEFSRFRTPPLPHRMTEYRILVKNVHERETCTLAYDGVDLHLGTNKNGSCIAKISNSDNEVRLKTLNIDALRAQITSSDETEKLLQEAMFALRYLLPVEGQKKTLLSGIVSTNDEWSMDLHDITPMAHLFISSFCPYGSTLSVEDKSVGSYAWIEMVSHKFSIGIESTRSESSRRFFDDRFYNIILTAEGYEIKLMISNGYSSAEIGVVKVYEHRH